MIQSVGAPPERHADRVVAEMLHWLVEVRAEMWEGFWKAIETGSFGNPIGQQRAVDRMRKAAGRFLPICHLEPGKRKRFDITMVEIGLWDPSADAFIDDAPAALPVKPWLAIRGMHIAGQGPRQHTSRSRAALSS
jgi:hypothetical protein